MKKLTLWLCMSLFLACAGFAQDKKLMKKLCRVWVPDKKAMAAALAGKPEAERMLRDLENEENVFLYILKDQTMYAGEPRRVMLSEWKISPDGKEFSFRGATLKITELSDTKFNFSVDSREPVFSFVPASKDVSARIIKRAKAESKKQKEGVKSEEPKYEEAKPAEEKKEEEKKRER